MIRIKELGIEKINELDTYSVTLLGITVSDVGGCPKLQDGSQVSRRLLKPEGRFAVRRLEDASEGFRKKPKVLESEGDLVARRSRKPPKVQGSERRLTARELDGFVRRYSPKLVFLSETMISESRVKNLRWRLGLKGCLAIDSRGKRGGLALFWDENIHVNLLSINDRYIDVSICDDPTAAPWRATFVYGEPRVEDRHKLWEILQRLKTRCSDPWVVIGDFNETVAI